MSSEENLQGPGPLAARRPGRPPGSSPGLAASRSLAALALLLTLLSAACSPGGDPVRDPDRLPEAAETDPQGSLLAAAELLPSPAPAGAQAPELSLVGGRPALTWLERTGEDSGDWRLRFARWSAGSGQPAEPGGFGEPVTVAPAPGEPLELFANWADRPGVVEGGPAGAPGGLARSRPLYAWWLAKLGGGTYAYGVHVARSADGGRTWEALGLLHDDSSPTEHGFVTLIPEDEGVRAVWLDGRETARGAPMALRTVRITDRVERATEELLDSAVCDCCNTAAVATAGGPLVAYRDRAAGEVRDIRTVHRTAGAWSEPAPLHRDGWEIAGCPVNGPALARHAAPRSGPEGETLWAAWFTAAGGEPRVLAAVSRDGGRSFGPPLTVADDGPLGRLALAVDAARGDAVVSWLGPSESGAAAIRLRRLGRDGRAGPAVALARAAGSRSSGVPRLLAYPSADGERLLVAWVEPAEGAREGAIRLATLPAAAVP